MTDDGHPPLEHYALLSGRQTAALVAHGSIDWLCLPRFDSPSVFTRLLGGPDNGYWRIRPRDGREVARSYRAGSFVLDTEWTTPAGAATTTDFLTMDRGTRDDDAVSLVRRVTCTGGSLEVDVDLVMRFDYGRVVPWVRRRSDGTDGSEGSVLYAIAGPDSLTLRGPRLQAHARTHHGRFRLEAGQMLTWVLTWLPSCDGLPPGPDADTELHHVLDDWADWRTRVAGSGRYAAEIDDSLAVLRALTSRRTGGIVAAPTTSLPEALGGERNWDYRFTWLRDSAFTIGVLAAHGHHHLAHQWRDWLLRAIAGDPEDLQIMYGVDGARELPEHILDHLSGYRGSTPVRVGNAAYTQYQADVIGEVMLALSRLREAGITEDRFSWGLQSHLLGLLESRLRIPDRGIWEVRGEPHLFTHGRVMMWAAFDQGVRAVERHGHPGPVERWRALRDELRAEILDRGVRDGSFVQHYDTDAVDAALLQIPQTGFVAHDCDIMLGTVARVEAELVDRHGFVRRYATDGSDGLAGSEGAFLMCTFWLVEQYARSGRGGEASALMSRLLDVRNDLGLLAEEYDPASGRMLGNYPQAFSHLALIRAAEALS